MWRIKLPLQKLIPHPFQHLIILPKILITRFQTCPIMPPVCINRKGTHGLAPDPRAQPRTAPLGPRAAVRAFPKGPGKKLNADKDEDRIPAFGLIDPLKRFAPEEFEWAEEWGKVQILPRISVPGLFDPVFTEPAPFPSRDDPVDTAALVRRIQALKEALDNLPRHAKRLARWKMKGELARRSAGRPKPGRLSPFRPGFAPGYHRHKPQEIDVILDDCHYFAREAWKRLDTS
jgi:hypothetical protein